MFAVYVSNAESGDISVLRLDPANASLTPVQTLPIGGELMPMALSPKRDRLYAARRTEPREALSFAIDAKTGELAPLGAGPLAHSMAYIATDRSGRWLFSASYGGNLVAVNAIDERGIVKGIEQIEATGPNAHAILADETNGYVFSTSLGGGVVQQFRFDAEAGRLTPNTPATLQPHAGASPRHFRFSTDQRFVYLLGELDGMVDVLGFDAATGTLAPLQSISSLTPDFSAQIQAQPWAADLQLTPNGRFIYTSERRSSMLTAFSVDAASGRLSLLGHTPTEAQPRGFAITPDGRFLISVGQLSQRVRLFAIEAQTGALSACGDARVGRGANWVECLSLQSKD